MLGDFPSRGECGYDSDYESNGASPGRKDPEPPGVIGCLFSLIVLGGVVALIVRACS